MSSSYEEIAFNKAVADRIFTRMQGDTYRCNACERSLNSKKLALYHFKSKSHQKEERSFVAPFVSAAINGMASGYDEDAVAIGEVRRTIGESFPSGLEPESYVRSPLEVELAFKKAVEDEVFSETGIGEFRCNACESDLNGKKSAIYHFNQKTHRRKEQEFRSAALPSPPTEEECQANAGEDEDVSGNMTFITKRNNSYICAACNITMNSDKAMRNHCRTAQHRKNTERQLKCTEGQPFAAMVKEITDEEYEIKSSPRGIVCVINNIFKDCSNYRRGAETDTKRIKETFEELNYHVMIREDISKNETMSVPSEIRKRQERFKTDCLIMFVLSHGKEGDLVQAFDSTESFFNFNEFFEEFLESKFPEFKDKPKIWFCSFCRGKNKELATDSAEPYEDNDIRVSNKKEPKKIVEVAKNTFICYASVENISAIRHEEEGALLVSKLCDILKKNREIELMMLYRTLEKEIPMRTLDPVMRHFIKRFHFYRTKN